MSAWRRREVRTCGCRPRCWLRSFRLGSSPGDWNPDQCRGPRFLPARSAAERRGAREAPAECSACTGLPAPGSFSSHAGSEVQLCTWQTTRDRSPSLSESGFGHRRVSERAGCIPTSLLVPFLLSALSWGLGEPRGAVSAKGAAGQAGAPCLQRAHPSRSARRPGLHQLTRDSSESSAEASLPQGCLGSLGRGCGYSR